MTDQELKNLVAGLAVSQAKTDQALKDLVDGFAASQAKADARQAKADARQAEADARQVEADARQAKADARQAKIDEQLAELTVKQANTDAQIAKTDAQIAKTDALVKDISRQYGNNINNQSRRAEEFFVNAIRKLKLQLAGVKFKNITANIARQTDSSGIELDALLINSEVVAILEVKTNLHINDVKEVYDKRIPNFRKIFSEYQDKDLLVIVAGLSIEKDALEKAHEYGFMCLQPDNQQIAIDASHSKRF